MQERSPLHSSPQQCSGYDNMIRSPFMQNDDGEFLPVVCPGRSVIMAFLGNQENPATIASEFRSNCCREPVRLREGERIVDGHILDDGPAVITVVAGAVGETTLKRILNPE